MPGELAPSLKHNSARHVEAAKYHEMMKDKDTVIIDVRNAYESAIGYFLFLFLFWFPPDFRPQR